jgi:hypothetical protein
MSLSTFAKDFAQFSVQHSWYKYIQQPSSFCFSLYVNDDAEMHWEMGFQDRVKLRYQRNPALVSQLVDHSVELNAFLYQLDHGFSITRSLWHDMVP